jgi:glycosyltransferase involved in cell wall biosynthesis
MKIVCVSASQVPSDTANSIQVMKVCQAFTQLGHNVTLLVPGPQPKMVDLLVHYGLQTPFTIEWLPTRNRHQFPWKAVWQARRLDPDLLYTWPIQAAVLSLLSGMDSMLEMHDFPSGFFGPFWFRLFLTLPGNKRLLPITEALRCALERRFRALPGREVVISPDGVDLERYLSLSTPAAARNELSLPQVETVLCTGHLYEGRGADLFLALAEKFPQFSFVWVGGRSEEVKIWATRSANKALTNVIFTGFVPNERIPLYQSAADILLMPYGKYISGSSGGNTADVCSPMKMFEYLAAGRAILTSDLPVLREVLDETRAVFCQADDAERWETALGKLLVDKKQRKVLGANALQAAQQYTWVERARRDLAGFEERG